METFDRSAWVFLALVVGMSVTGRLQAAEENTPQMEYGSKVTAARSINALEDNLFGDTINSYTGSLQFSVVDADIPGNAGLEVRVARHLDVNETRGKMQRHRAQGAPFRNWDFDIPHLHGLFSSAVGWQAGPTAGIRCDQPDPTKAAPPASGAFPADTFWSGNFLYVPGKGNEEIVHVGNSTVKKPTTGGPYRWMTKSLWYFSCLSTTANGSGDSFQAISPDGTKYWFNQIAGRPAAPVKISPSTITRTEVWFLPTRIEDRFGNYVTYTYSPTKSWNITRIDGSDGRYLSIAYNTKVTGPYVETVTDGLRTWRYEYLDGVLDGRLTAVVLPDSTKISYSFGALSADHVDQAFSGCGSAPAFLYAPDFDLGITHPSGLTANFKLNMKLHGRTYVPRACWIGQSDSFDLVPKTFATLTLTGKELSGVGLENPKLWSWAYPPYNASGKYADECVSTACATTKQVSVTQPDGTVVRATYGIKYNENDGILLSSETFAAGAGAPIKTELFTYQTSPIGRPYPQFFGTPTRTYMDPSAITLRPQLSKQTILDGVSFVKAVSSSCNGNNTACFDDLARPLIEDKYSVGPGMGFSRSEEVAYYDDYSSWSLGQVASVKCIAPAECKPTWAPGGIVTAQTNFNPSTALPVAKYSFGKLQQTLSYYADGTLATLKDGNNNVTTLTNWYRGIPRNIQYADGTTRSAAVNGNGWITATTDESGFTTDYGYDLMGRLDRIIYPAGDTTGWNDTTFTWEYRNFPEHGLPAGHWLRSQITGNGYKNVFLDALWRPMLVHEFDAANISGTLRATSTEYDSSGRPVFQSYPSNSTIPAASGSWTSYDPLDRVTSVRQDSELGQLTTTTEYLTGFQTRITNPRGLQLTTQYEAYNQPTTSFPAGITASADTATEIHRDVFGKPTLLVRRNHTSTQRVERRYIYDGYQQLCKTIEPETGATVMDYDGAGNLQWSAAGTALTSTSSCDTIAGRDSGRKVTRYYDTRNRLTQLQFPDGRGNQSWTYTPDGLPSTITTWNGLGGDGPVVNHYVYNKRRLLTGEHVEQPTWYAWGIGYGYDANGSLSTQTYPTGLLISYAPNALGQATQAGNYASGVQYYANGGIKQFTYGNGIVHTMGQNDRQLPSRSTDTGVIDFTFAYDANGNTTAIRDVNAVQYAYSGNRDLVYDGLDRLTQAHLHWWQIDDWTYDALDNIQSKAHFDGSTSVTQDYTYDGSNQLVNVQEGGATTVGLLYDEQGNLKNKNGVIYEFDFGNRLRGTIGQEWYRYDGYGRRVLNWRWNESGVLSQYSQTGQLMYDENYRASGRKATEYVYLAGSVVAARERNIDTNVYATKYQHTDALGSPVAVTDAAGAVIERTNYEPYGAAINKTVDGIGYTGHVMDAATGLTYMQQRYMDPSIGRFLSVDPVTANSNTGANFNRYQYASNNPYSFTDPDGRQQFRTNYTPSQIAAKVGLEQAKLRLAVAQQRANPKAVAIEFNVSGSGGTPVLNGAGTGSAGVFISRITDVYLSGGLMVSHMGTSGSLPGGVSNDFAIGASGGPGASFIITNAEVPSEMSGQGYGFNSPWGGLVWSQDESGLWSLGISAKSPGISFTRVHTKTKGLREAMDSDEQQNESDDDDGKGDK